MAQWKAAGRASRADDDALWARFRAAQDAFFAARDAQSAATDEEFRANLEVKEALLVEAEALLPVTDLAAAKSALHRIQDRWEAAGKVPRADVQRIEGRLRAVETAVRDTDQAQWTRTNPETRARAEGAAAQLEQAIAGLEADLDRRPRPPATPARSPTRRPRSTPVVPGSSRCSAPRRTRAADSSSVDDGRGPRPVAGGGLGRPQIRRDAPEAPGRRHAAAVSTRLDAFRTTVPVLPRTVRRDDVGAAAWFGLLRDGVVRVVWGDVAIAADLRRHPGAAGGRARRPGARPRRRRAADAPPGCTPAATRPCGSRCWSGPARRRTDPHPARVAAEATLSPPDDVVRVGCAPGDVGPAHRRRHRADAAAGGGACRRCDALLDVGFEPDPRPLDRLAGQRLRAGTAATSRLTAVTPTARRDL